MTNTPPTEEIPKYKIIFLGDQGVGKSSILNRFANDKFENNYQATIGLDFHSKSVKMDNQDVRLLLYDTAGQEKFRSLIPMYIRDANIIIVVFDITSKDSFKNTQNWLDQIKDIKRSDAIFALVGNKYDLNDKRSVSYDEALTFAKERSIIYHEVSAKTGENINQLFYKDIFDQIIASFKIQGGEEEIQDGLKLEGGSQQGAVNKKKNKCC